MKQSLLRRFRWPIVIAFVSGIVLMCIAAVVKMNDDTFATVGICLFIGSFAAAAALEMIDETKIKHIRRTEKNYENDET